MAGWLTTHVLDTARGRPAAGLEVALYRLDGEARTELARMRTNADGRTDQPILPQDAFATGTYELVFAVGDWLTAEGVPGEAPRFLGDVPIRFDMGEASHFHVPLLVSPYSYSTYRGS